MFGFNKKVTVYDVIVTDTNGDNYFVELRPDIELSPLESIFQLTDNRSKNLTVKDGLPDFLRYEIRKIPNVISIDVYKN